MTVIRIVFFYLEDAGSVMIIVCDKFTYRILLEACLQLNANPFHLQSADVYY